MSIFVRVYLVFSAVVISALIVMSAILVFRINAAVTQNKANATSSCQQSNVSRQEDIAIWDSLLTSVGTPTSAAARHEIADLQRLVEIKDTPRVC